MVMGTHIATLVRLPINPSLLFLVLFSSLFVHSSCEPTDIESLLTFKDSLTTSSRLNNWNASISPCKGNKANWVGVLCLRGKIIGLQLENMYLSGEVNMESLDALQDLRTLSLMNNDFEGKIPDIKKSRRLQALFLSNNRFSGEIPDDTFEGMKSLRKVFLANNAFTGKFPSSLSASPQLSILKAEGNRFSGTIPEFTAKNLKVVNLANNQFEGPIPESLSKLSANMFSGNKNLCGTPLNACKLSHPLGPPPIPSPQPSPPETIKKTSGALTVALIMVSVVLLTIIALLAFLLIRRRGRSRTLEEQDSFVVDESYNYKPPPYVEEGEKKVPETAAAAAAAPAPVKRSELTFLRDDVQRFDLQDLLRASAEILGSGNFGASYKAIIGKGESVVVKNYKQMNHAGKEDFNEHMRRLGRLNHQNLLPVLAYYYRKEEKLLVSKFVDNGSLASHLHANRSLEKPGLHWQTRLKIIKGVVKGMTYLYNELPTLVVPNGNLKSSNVLLDNNYEPLLCDYALRSVINQEQAHTLMMAYKSPEYAMNGRINRKTDVWCLGILILEVLTGRFPENYLTASYDSNTNLATWVNNMVKEKKISEVFDSEMKGTKNSKGEMINLLKIGLSCCEEDAEARPELKEVVKEIEGLKKEDDDDDELSSTIGEVNAIISGEINRKDDHSSSFSR